MTRPDIYYGLEWDSGFQRLSLLNCSGYVSQVFQNVSLRSDTRLNGDGNKKPCVF